MRNRALLTMPGFLVLMFALAIGMPAGVTVAQDGLDMDHIFRCTASDDTGRADCLEARNIITNNCTVCHTFVPIVMQQFDADGWTGLLDRHVQNGRVDQLSAEQVTKLHDYLSDNFNGDLPPPELPPELLATWTSY